MSFTDVRAGIHANLRNFTDVRNIIGGMPTELHFAPAFITVFQEAERIGQTSAFHWRFELHAAITRQANDIAESAIDEMAETLFQAFSIKLNDANGRPRAMLGGAAQNCWLERMASGETDGYITFGSGDSAKTYRHIGVVLVVKTMEAY